MPTLFVPDGNGNWVEATEAYVEHNGAWEREYMRFVQADGKWVESMNAEPTGSHPLIEITDLKFRGGNVLQGDLTLQGYGLSDVVPIEPRLGAFYTFRSTLRCYFDNFGKVDLYGDSLPLPDTVDGRPVYALAASEHQYMTANITTRGFFDFRGLVLARTPWEDWQLGGKIHPTDMPTGDTTVPVYFMGDKDQCISVFFDAHGTLFGVVANGSTIKILRIENAVTINQWTGFVLRHKKGGILELIIHDGRKVSATGGIAYWVPDPMIPIYFGFGKAFGFTAPPTPDYFNADNTSPAFTISQNGKKISTTGTAYHGAQPGGEMAPNTGKYYVEFLYEDSYDSHYGLAEPGANVEGAAGIVSWAVNTINGKKFNHQTGGGSTWDGKQTAPGTTISIMYDSDQGFFEIYRDGVKAPNPFPAGTITVPVKFIISGRANQDHPEASYIVNLDPSTWAYRPASHNDAKPFPREQASSTRVDSGWAPLFGRFTDTDTYYTGQISDFFLMTTQMVSDEHLMAVLDPSLKFRLMFHSLDGQHSYDASDSVIIQKGGYAIMNVPEVPKGNYWMQAELVGHGASTKRFFTVDEFESRNTPLVLDFATATTEEIREGLLVAHKAWGGLNGGVVQDNVTINHKDGLLEIVGLGDLYNGDVKGVDRLGHPSGFNRRIGACVATRDYFGPASYRVLCSFPKKTGVCSAFWTFHYEEGYPGSVLFDRHKADGIHISGKEADGFYTVRNHEIDIEVPTALKTDLDMEVTSYQNARFNTWHGELRNWNVPNNDVNIHDPMYSPTNDPAYWSEYTDDFVHHGVNLNDGAFHEVRFDWHLGDDPRVEFYIDGVHHHTVKTHVPDIPGRFWVGLWFPSSGEGNFWTGKEANFVYEVMRVKKIEIHPFTSEFPHARQFTETYPWDVYRDFKKVIK